ncbi:MAG: GNAT family N-acetyltransferase [Pseudomonadota bacterium]
MLHVRQARAEDVPRLYAIAEAAYAGYVPLIGRKPAPMVADFAALTERGVVDVAVAEKGDAVRVAPSGYIVHYAVDAETWHLENIAVAPEGQGRGIGGALIAYAEDAARLHGARTMTLYTNAKMAGNLTLYPALGYVETRRAQEDGFDRVFFEKPL